MLTSLPMLIKPVLLYSPSQSPQASLAAPLKVTVRQQGGELDGREQVNLGSSSKSLPILYNQPVVGGRKGSSPTFAFRDGSYPFC